MTRRRNGSAKKLGRKRIRIYAAAVVIITAAVFLCTDLLRTEASSRFPGVDTIITRYNDAKTPYTILEIAPEASLGEIGYYVKDGEYNYITPLMENAAASSYAGGTASSADPSLRNSAFLTIRNDLIARGICAPDTASAEEAMQYPLSGGTYEEKFLFGEGESSDGWQRFTLPDTVSFDVSGVYTAANGNGDFDVIEGSTAGFKAVEAGTGAYDIVFETNLTDTQSEAYKNASKYGAYELLADGTYRKVSNTYRNSTDYYVSTVTASAGKIGRYDSLQAYSFNKSGTGSYSFAEDDTAPMNSVSIGKVWYKAGFTNNELLEKNVFGIADSSLYTDFNIKVYTMTEESLSQKSLQIGDIPNFDMIYIAGDATGSNTTYGSVRANGIADGKTANDYMDYSRMQTLLNSIFETAGASGNRSCIINYGILDKVVSGTESLNDSYVYKLAAALLQKNVKATFTASIYQRDETDIDWNTILSGAETNGASSYHNFVADNVYSFYDTSAITGSSGDTKRGLVSKHLADVYSDTALITNGFQSIIDLVDSENTVRSYSDPLNSDISQARAIQFIINSWNPRQTDIKTTINILEIEPSNSFDLTADSAKVKVWAADLINKAKDEKGEDIVFNIDQMTTAEFIGKINDMNTDYDMIYIGMNTGMMNVDAVTGRTVYNDTNMNGLVYTHTGDSVICSSSLAGILDRDYVDGSHSNYLFSQTINGNGLSVAYGSTATKYSYNRTTGSFTVTNNSKTITGAENMMTGESNQTWTMKDVGVYRYSGNDITSFKLEQLVDYVKGRYAVVIDSDAFQKDAGGKPTGVDDSYIDNSSNMYTFLNTVKGYDNVITYDKTADTLSNQAKFVSYLNMNKPQLSVSGTSGKTTSKTLAYDITIESNVETDASTKYTLAVYVDINADGQYSNSEDLTDCVVTSATGESIPRDADGHYLLSSNVAYHVTKLLGSSYVGYIPYKIEVSNSAPEYSSIRSSYTGSCEIVGENSEKENINILQIMQASYMTGSYAGNFNMQTQASSSSSTFSKLLNGVSGYDITITSIPSDQYVTQFNAAAANGENYLDNYNMLVLGFADVYSDISNTIPSSSTLQLSPLGGVLKFIKDGKSVLFTHDTTSFVNVASSNQLTKTNNYNYLDGVNGGTSYWGYNINSILRSVVGMDRFGVTGTSHDLLETGNVLYFGNGGTDINSISAHDFSYVANSSKSYASGEVQGYTNNLLNMKRINNLNAHYDLLDSAKHANDNGSYSEKMWASQVNTGQITEYPYKIDESIPVAKTHYQYYQLDLDADDDNDGESDIVVWYTLSNVTKSTSSSIDTDQVSNIYSVSPNDVRNNYYIYSKGNVMYSGVGHSTVSGNEMELKLYINTLIAAYKNGAQAPVPTIRENASINSSEKTNEYITYDEALSISSGDAGSLNKSITLYYEVIDPNLVSSNKTISVSYYIEDPAGDTVIPGTGITGRVIDGSQGQTMTASGTAVDDDGLQSGNMYQITIPNAYSYLGSESSCRIYIVLTSNFDYYGKQISLTGYDTLSLIREQLFDLN